MPLTVNMFRINHSVGIFSLDIKLFTISLHFALFFFFQHYHRTLKWQQMPIYLQMLSTLMIVHI